MYKPQENLVNLIFEEIYQNNWWFFRFCDRK